MTPRSYTRHTYGKREKMPQRQEPGQVRCSPWHIPPHRKTQARIQENELTNGEGGGRREEGPKDSRKENSSSSISQGFPSFWNAKPQQRHSNGDEQALEGVQSRQGFSSTLLEGPPAQGLELLPVTDIPLVVL